MNVFDKVKYERNKIIMNKEVLSPSYVPPTLIRRSDKEEQLAKYFLDLLERPGKVYSYAIISGPQGVGKTHLALHFYNELRAAFEKETGKNILLAHINCYLGYRSLSQILRGISTALRLGIPTRGISHTEMLEYILKALERSDKYVLVILDDFQYALYNDWEIARFFARLDERSSSYGQRMHVIIIMNNINILFSYVNDEKLKNWKRRHVYMPPYTQPELYEILEDRRDKAFYPNTVPDEILFEISKWIGVDTSKGLTVHAGSARLAIETLRLSAERAENLGKTQVEIDDLRYAWAELNKQGDLMTISDLIERLNDHELLFLYSLASVLEATGESYVRIGKVEEEYRMLCETLGIEPRKHTQIYEYARKLSYLGIVKRETPSKGMRGRSTLLTIEFPLAPFKEKIIQILRMRNYEL